MAGAPLASLVWTSFTLLAGSAELPPVNTATIAEAPVPRVDLITIGVGHAMYAVFGHAALRVIYPDGRDVAFNYGGVDIEQEGFWFKLMQGRVDAYLEVTSYSDLLLKYSGEDRSIWGRRLALSDAQARELVAALEANNTDANRNYRYHHIFDNCTTRAAIILDETLQGQLSRSAAHTIEGTHRDWILDRIRHEPWLFLAMDLAGNGQGDVPITAWDTIFIPEAVDAIIDQATVDGHPLVAEHYTDYVSMSIDPKVEWDWPWTKVYLLLALPWLCLALWKPRWAALISALLATAAGLAYSGFWLLSDYDFYHRNWNMLLYPPTHAFVFWSALSSKRWSGRSLQGYLHTHSALVLVVAVLIATGLITQAIGASWCLAATFSWTLSFKAWRARRT